MMAHGVKDYGDCYLSKTPNINHRQNNPTVACSGNERRGGGGVIFEGWCDLLFRLVVAGEPVNTGLD